MKLLSDQITPDELAVVLTYAQRAAAVDGDFVEFGCYVGTTSVHLQPLARAQHKMLHVYDSFAGLPAKSPQDDSPAGLEFQAGELAASKKVFIANFKKANQPLPVIHKGWFADLTSNDVPQKISFGFLDGDFHGSIADSLRLCWPALQPEGWLLVHDYGRVTLPGVKRAVDEFLDLHSAATLARVQEHIAVIQAP